MITCTSNKVKALLLAGLCVFSISAALPASEGYFGQTYRFPWTLYGQLTWVDCHGTAQIAHVEVIVPYNGANHVTLKWNFPWQTWEKAYTVLCVGERFNFMSGFLINLSQYDTSQLISILAPPVSPESGFADQMLTLSGICCWRIFGGDTLTFNMNAWYGLVGFGFSSYKFVGATGTVGLS